MFSLTAPISCKVQGQADCVKKQLSIVTVAVDLDLTKIICKLNLRDTKIIKRVLFSIQYRSIRYCSWMAFWLKGAKHELLLVSGPLFFLYFLSPLQ